MLLAFLSSDLLAKEKKEKKKSHFMGIFDVPGSA